MGCLLRKKRHWYQACLHALQKSLRGEHRESFAIPVPRGKLQPTASRRRRHCYHLGGRRAAEQPAGASTPSIRSHCLILITTRPAEEEKEERKENAKKNNSGGLPSRSRRPCDALHRGAPREPPATLAQVNEGWRGSRALADVLPMPAARHSSSTNLRTSRPATLKTTSRPADILPELVQYREREREENAARSQLPTKPPPPRR